MDPSEEPIGLDRVMIACALRFDGYAYVQSRNDPRLLVTLPRRFEDTLIFSDIEEENHVTFFAYQRYLCKWGGESLGPETREHFAYRTLFIRLHAIPVPDRWRFPPLTPEWDWDALPKVAIERAVRRAVLLNDHYGCPPLGR